jgi:hypothetical protein
MGRTVWALALACAFTALVYAAFWTIGSDVEDAVPVSPWYELSFLAAVSLGLLSDRWRYVLVALVVLPIGFGPQMGTPGSDGDTLNTWWFIVGPFYAVFSAVAIAVGIVARKLWNRGRRRRALSGAHPHELP